MAFIPNQNRFQRTADEKVEGLFYTKIARVIAFLGILISVVVVIGGFFDESLYFITVGLSAFISSIIIGVLSDISVSVAKGSAVQVTSSRRAPPTDPEQRRKWANREPPYDE